MILNFPVAIFKLKIYGLANNVCFLVILAIHIEQIWKLSIRIFVCSFLHFYIFGLSLSRKTPSETTGHV